MTEQRYGITGIGQPPTTEKFLIDAEDELDALWAAREAFGKRIMELEDAINNALALRSSETGDPLIRNLQAREVLERALRGKR